MIRFYDKEVVCVYQNELDRRELLSYFLKGHRNDCVIVLDEQGQYQGQITYPLLLSHQEIADAIDTSHVIFDEEVWANGRKFFREYISVLGEIPLLPVLNRDRQLLCFAYEDEEANREIRMLRELEACEKALGFKDLYPEYDCVTIDGCNELAYYLAMYLKEHDIPFNVTGDLWSELGVWQSHAALEYRNYHVYAEGTEQLQADYRYRLLQSASPEFECIDVIYEANLNQKIIVDAEGEWTELLEKLRDKEEIVILGAGEEAQDAYDLLQANGVECCCFAAKVGDAKHKLFGKKIISEKEAMNRWKYPIFIECCSEHSSWGLGSVDYYDYYGFHRNEQFFVIQDYIEVPKNNLWHVIAGKKVALVGDIYLCHKLYRYFSDKGNDTIGYFELGEEKQQHNFEMPKWKNEDLTEEVLCLCVIPQYNTIRGEKYIESIEHYKRLLQECGILNYTYYFSRQEALLYLEMQECKYTKPELIPKGIVLGNIPAYSGNYFTRDVFGGNPDIRFMEYTYLNENLLLFCIRLSQIKASEIPSIFWEIYEKEVGIEKKKADFPQIELFQEELENLLKLSDKFTSQELFVIFHMAYAKMCGKEVKNINSIVIYWEPHLILRQFIVKSAMWLNSNLLPGYTMEMTRNRYVAVGSGVRIAKGDDRYIKYNLFHCIKDINDHEWESDNWEQFVIRFEDLKCNPIETYSGICQRLGITWSDSLIESVQCNNYEGIAKGFDLKPVYNNYEEYLTGYDRMKISILQSLYQKKHAYPYMNVSDFTRKELQNMFLKNMRFEQKMVDSYSEETKWEYYMYRQQLVTQKLWKLRQMERIERLEEEKQ